jgi:anti-sigma B factor antagonist
MTNNGGVPISITIRCEEQGDTLVMFVAGELDMAAKGRLVSEADWQRHDVKAVVIDMSELEFMDSTGLSDIVSMSVAAEAEGVTVTVRAARANVRRVFDITGMARFLED